MNLITSWQKMCATYIRRFLRKIRLMVRRYERAVKMALIKHELRRDLGYNHAH